MTANAAIYIPIESPDLAKVFPDAKSDQGLFKRKPSWFSMVLGGDPVKFNVMAGVDLPRHIEGFVGYIQSLDEDHQRKHDAATAVRLTKCVLGLQTSREFEENPAIWQALFRIADAFDGYVFVHDSLLLPGGGVIVGPLRQAT